MYCEDSLGTDIDHYKPKAIYPDVAFEWSNYLLACSHCNANEKRNKFPLDDQGNALLVDPSVDDPLAHLALLPHLGEFASRSNRGLASIDVFGLNRPELVQGRLDAWLTLDILVRRYVQLMHDGRVGSADLVRSTIANSAFSMVAQVMRAYALAGVELLSDELRTAVNEYPDVLRPADQQAAE